MEAYQQNLVKLLAEKSALYFEENLFLKDGRPTPYLVNMEALNYGRDIFELGGYYARMIVENKLVDKFDVLLGLSYKGIDLPVATTIALSLKHGINTKSYEFDRKEAKAHGDASNQEKMFVKGAFFNQARILMLDDVATSMDTKREGLEKIKAEAERKKMDLQIVGIAVAFDREQTTAVYDQEVPVGLNDKDLSPWKKQHVQLGIKGEDAKKKFTGETGIPIYSMVGASESIDFLHSHPYVKVSINKMMSSLDKETKERYYNYQQLYGV